MFMDQCKDQLPVPKASLSLFSFSSPLSSSLPLSSPLSPLFSLSSLSCCSCCGRFLKQFPSKKLLFSLCPMGQQFWPLIIGPAPSPGKRNPCGLSGHDLGREILIAQECSWWERLRQIFPEATEKVVLRVLALFVVDPGLIPGISCGLVSTTRNKS